MRHCLTIWLLLLAACGPSDVREVVASPPISADLLVQRPGWTGPTPTQDGQFVDAAAAEKRGRLQCNGQILTIAQTIEALNQPNPQ